MAQKHLVNSQALTHTLLLPICRSSLSTAFQNDPRRAIERKKNEKKKKKIGKKRERKLTERRTLWKLKENQQVLLQTSGENSHLAAGPWKKLLESNGNCTLRWSDEQSVVNKRKKKKN